MTAKSDKERALDARGRVVAVVIAVAAILSVIAPWLVVVLHLPMRYEFLIYFASLAGFVWAFVNIYQIWRARRDSQG